MTPSLRFASASALVASLLACSGLGSPSFATARGSVTPGDAAALDALLLAAGRAPADLKILPVGAWSSSDEAAVVIEAERVTCLRLRGAGLASMAPVAPLDALRELDLSQNRIERLEGLGAASALEVLNLRGNALVGLGGLDAASALRWLYVDDNRIASTAGLASLPALADLSLNGNQLTTIDGLASRGALTGLYLERNQLASLDGVHDLPVLATLAAGGNRIVQVDALRGLPKLRNLSLAGNRLVDVAVLATLPALAFVDLERNLVRSPPVLTAEVKLAGNPVDGSAAAPSAPGAGDPTVGAGEGAIEGTAAALPERTGHVLFGSARTSAGGAGSRASGRMGKLVGTVCPEFGERVLPQRVRATVSVESGRVRLWLRDGENYRWRLAEPDRPAILEGAPIRSAHARMGEPRGLVCVEAVGGEARGVEYMVIDG
ncbi:MAG: hypothetical protein Q8P18_06900 [Pseudomonadota bacterium]|nr:hypothetical protein [Pseudomonadota bacterium]